MEKSKLLILLFIVFSCHKLYSNQIDTMLLAASFNAEDSLVIKDINNKVFRWYSSIDTSVFAEQLILSRQPTYVDSISEINNCDALWFEKNRMQIGNEFPVDSFNFVTLLIKPYLPGGISIFLGKGYSGDGCFTLSESGGKLRFYIDGQTLTTSVDLDTAWVVLTVELDRVNRLINIYKNGLLDYSVNAAGDLLGPNSFSWTIGADAGANIFHFKGFIADIIFLDMTTNNQNRMEVENFLLDKYGAAIELGADINMTLFKDTIIGSDQFFSSYLWSTGDTTENVTVFESGTYTLSVTDIFGVESSDKLIVSYPEIDYPISGIDTILCLGDTLWWDTGLSRNYSFDWFGSNSDSSSIAIAEAGQYSVKVIDSLGGFKCFDTIIIVIDSFPVKNSLGVDKDVCKGSFITLDEKGYDIQSWFWSTGSTDEYIQINSANQYAVTVININGCQGGDSVFFGISGEAPVVYFEADTACFGNSTVFVNSSIISDPDIISSYRWSFGDGKSSSIENPKHSYATVDTFLVTLTVNTTVGCDNFYQDTVMVKAKPFAGFYVEYGNRQCVNNQIQFVDTSLAVTVIEDYNWDFGDTSSAYEAIAVNTFSQSGTFDVMLKVADQNGCADSISNPIEIEEDFPKPGAFNLLAPINKSNINDTLINLIWSTSEKANYYNAKVWSTDDDFIVDSVKLESTSLNICIAPYDSILWQINAYNLCGDSISSALNEFYYFSLNDYDGTQLSFNAIDKLVIKDTDNKVSRWYNSIDTNVFAEQLLLSRQPTYMDRIKEINNHDAIWFETNRMQIGNDFSIDSFNFATFVIKPYLPGDISVFMGKGYSGDGCFTLSERNGKLRFYIDGQTLTTPVELDTAWVVLTVELDRQSGFIKIYKNGLLDYSVSATGDLSGSNDLNWTIGADASANIFHFKGFIADIIFLDTTTDNQNRIEVENYLKSKYSPFLSLGNDINLSYGFAEILLQPNHYFVDYLWNSADTTPTLTVSESGTYSVTVTDIFGFTSSDTIKVTYPEPNQISDTTICLYDTLHWNTNLTGPYYYEWSTAAVTPDLKITEPGDYWVKITDTLGYSWYSDTITVTVNEFPAIVSLGNDTTLCHGNRLYLKAGRESAVSYLWSDNSTDSNFELQTSGEYSVTVTNTLGCNGTDSVNISIDGVAPVVLFSADNFCFNDTVQFTDLSTPPSGYSLVSWEWDFGDLSNSSETNPEYKYSTSGSYQVEFTVGSDNNCTNTLYDSVTILNLPQVNSGPPATCSHALTQMVDLSTSIDGNITGWLWIFPNDSTSSEQNPVHIFESDGDNIVRLQATTEFGCKGEDSLIVLAKPGPETDFTYSAACDSQIVYFANNSVGFLNLPLYYEWFVDSALFSYVNNPSVVLGDTGTYVVRLVTTQTSNLCSSEAEKVIRVYRNPVAAFDMQEFCVNGAEELTENSYSLDGSVTEWLWRIDSIGYLIEQNPMLSFSNEGSYNAHLKVTDENGCIDTLTNVLMAYPVPEVSFQANPYKGAVPLNVDFSNYTTGADTYYWIFDDGEVSGEFEPTHVFGQEKDYSVSLKATSTNNCADSVTKVVRGIDAFIDVAILSLNTTITGGYLTVSALLQNRGTLDMDNVDIRYHTNLTGRFKEVIKDTIVSGQTYSFEFSTKLELKEYETLDYVCVQVLMNGVADNVPEDNESCEVFEKGFKPSSPFPNPANNYMTAEYLIPEAGNVKISLVNSIGKHTRVLYDDDSAKGFNRLIFDLRTVNDGMYFYRVEYDGAIATFPVVIKR